MDPFDEPSAEQLEIYRKMTPAEKFYAMAQLYVTARRFTAMGIKRRHPHLSSEEIGQRVRDAFLYARD